MVVLKPIEWATRLGDLRTGWIMWCKLCEESDCINDDQRHGFNLAAQANEGGGNRPTAYEAYELGTEDLP